MDIGPGEILIVLLVVVLLFGGAKLPKLARSLGSAKGEFEKGLREGDKATTEPASTPTPTPATPPAAAVGPAPTAPDADETGTVPPADPTASA